MSYLMFLWMQMECIQEFQGNLSLETRETASTVARRLPFGAFLVVTDAMEV